MSRVNVVQYNILAQTLTEGIEVEDPVCVEEAPRFEKIKDKLLQQMNLEEGGGAILCLQEVSYSAAGPFHCFFNQHDYYVAWCPYGSPFNNYMGVMIAFPSARYSLLSMDFKCLADQISSAVNNQDESSSSNNSSNGGNDDGSGNRRMSMLEGSTWILAANRRNAMLSVKLGIKGTDRSFLVATYHMPCAFRTPLVMNIHASLLLNHLSTLTNRFVDPLILCIDGNFVPFSDCHNAFVHGVTNQFDSLGNKELVSLVLKDYNLVDPKDRSLFSVYWKANGKEPLFTNRSKNPEDFTGTLDYIFVNWGKWNVERVLPLPEVATKFYPSIEEPSDHLLLMAELTLI